MTASADQGARQTIRRIARENPGARIVATGCYATRCADGGRGAARRRSTSCATTTSAQLVRRCRSRARGCWTVDGPCGRPLAPGLMGRTAWTLRVQTGCEESCSYCIIPTTRGREPEPDASTTSGPRSNACRRRGLQGDRDHRRASRFVRTRSDAASLERPGRSDADRARGVGSSRPLDPMLFRISSLEPMDFPREPRSTSRWRRTFICRLQHASNRDPEAMKRPYYHRVLPRARGRHPRRLPHAAIGSDVIVGFPGETDDDFDELATYLERSPLTHLHVFPYSDRPGTVASSAARQGARQRRSRRERSGCARSRACCRSVFATAQRGTVRPALTIEDGSVAVTDNYIRVPAPSGHARNEWVTVTL